MPAQKWNIDIREIVEWMINGEQEFNEMIMSLELEDNNHISPDEKQAGNDPNEPEEPIAEFPSELPILPLRGLVVYPQTAVPLTIGQPRSIKLVDDAISSNRWVGLVTSRNTENENPLLPNYMSMEQPLSFTVCSARRMAPSAYWCREPRVSKLKNISRKSRISKQS